MRNQGPFSILTLVSHLPLSSIFMPPPIFPHETTNSQILGCNLPWSLDGLALLFLCRDLGVKKFNLSGTDPADNWQICCWKRKLSAFGVSPQKRYLHRLKVSPLSRWLYSRFILFLIHWCRKIQIAWSQELCKINDLLAFLTVSHLISFQHISHAYLFHWIPVFSMARWDFEANLK